MMDKDQVYFFAIYFTARKYCITYAYNIPWHADTVLYSYAPDTSVDPSGGGTVIPLPSAFGE